MVAFCRLEQYTLVILIGSFLLFQHPFIPLHCMREKKREQKMEEENKGKGDVVEERAL